MSSFYVIAWWVSRIPWGLMDELISVESTSQFVEARPKWRNCLRSAYVYNYVLILKFSSSGEPVEFCSFRFQFCVGSSFQIIPKDKRYFNIYMSFTRTIYLTNSAGTRGVFTVVDERDRNPLPQRVEKLTNFVNLLFFRLSYFIFPAVYADVYKRQERDGLNLSDCRGQSYDCLLYTSRCV